MNLASEPRDEDQVWLDAHLPQKRGEENAAVSAIGLGVVDRLVDQPHVLTVDLLGGGGGGRDAQDEAAKTLGVVRRTADRDWA